MNLSRVTRELGQAEASARFRERALRIDPFLDAGFLQPGSYWDEP
jgi:hypothetical protein